MEGVCRRAVSERENVTKNIVNLRRWIAVVNNGSEIV